MNDLFIKLRNKLIWSSVIRSILQSYFKFCFMSFTFVDVNRETNLLTSYLKICFLLLVPIGFTIFLFRNKAHLSEQQYLTKYGTLYQDLRFHYFPEKLQQEAEKSLINKI